MVLEPAQHRPFDEEEPALDRGLEDRSPLNSGRGRLPGRERVDYRVQALLPARVQHRLDLRIAAAAAAEECVVGGFVLLDKVEEAVEAGSELLGWGQLRI